MNNNNTSDVYEETFFIVPRYILKLEGLTFAYLKVFETIYQFWNKGRPCFLSNPRIESRTGVNQREVRNALAFFEKHNELERKVINGQRYLMQPQKIIKTDCSTFEGGSTDPGGRVYSPGGGGSTDPHNIKKTTNKELENNINKHARDPEQNPTISKMETTGTSGDDEIKSVPQQQKEGKEMIDPNYESPETYFPMATSHERGYSLTPHDVDTFEWFWSLYPRKSGKEKAKAQWFHDGCHLMADKIIGKLQEQIKKDKAFLDGYVPNPHKYIAEKRYNDEVFEGKKGHFDYQDTSWINKRDIFDT